MKVIMPVYTENIRTAPIPEWQKSERLDYCEQALPVKSSFTEILSKIKRVISRI